MVENNLLPIVNGETRLLIVGSMPGVQSLAKQQYYGNPRNHFWGIMSELANVPIPNVYEKKLQLVQQLGIGLWDVIQSCERQGSLDSRIKNEVPNDFAGLFAQYPQIEAIAFNGTKAYDVFKKHIGFSLLNGKAYYKMPSTSPVPGRYIKTFEQKLALWRELEPHMRRN